jgi:hypothetical protein
VGVLYCSLHKDQQGKKGSLFPEAKQIQKRWGFFLSENEVLRGF